MSVIELTRGKVALVDEEDYKELSKYKWHYNSDGYARRGVRKDGKVTVFWIHRLVAKTPKGMETDHINGDRLDNRKANLRVCTRGENLRNRKTGKNNVSGVKGVCWNKESKKWQAGIKFEGKSKHLGMYEKIEDAAAAYAKAAKKIFGKFARIK